MLIAVGGMYRNRVSYLITAAAGSCYMCSFDMVSHFICRCLSGRERAYTIHNYEVNIHASPSASLDSMTSGSNKVKLCVVLTHGV